MSDRTDAFAPSVVEDGDTSPYEWEGLPAL
jgi:hypothetical protein